MLKAVETIEKLPTTARLKTVEPFQARKKSTLINSLGLETAGWEPWGGGLSRAGVGSKSSFPLSKVCLPRVSGNLGYPRSIAGMFRTFGGVKK